MISNKLPIIAELVVVIFMTSLVTIATVLPVNNDWHVKMQLFAKLKIFLLTGFRATLNFRKFKVESAGNRCEPL